ncbi:MAG: efflux RND transporter periplasmic adaptor subunit [Anaerotignum sp.]|nr:efflux RND transporter periplasmic adaptor subunit [Anaerotignum sp.]
MKKKLLIALAMCMALGTGCGKEKAEEEKTARSVEIMTVGKGEIASEFAYTGKVAASREVSIVPTIPGKVTNFNFDVGDKVTKGAVLFNIDTIDLNNNLRSAEAGYNVAKLARDNAKNTYENNKLLFDEEIISQMEFDQIKYAYEAAEAQLASVQVQLDTLKKSISDCAVTSPLTGVVATRSVEIGGFASQAMPSYTVMDLSVVKVEVGVSEQVLNSIHVGDKVDVLITAVSELPLEGVVSTVAPAAGQTGMYAVKIELDNAEGMIKAGMMAEVNFTAESAEDTIVLPRNAVITKDDETYVYVVENSTAKKVPVELGIETGEVIEITAGLKDGDQVVTKGQTYISDGEEVNVMNAAPTAETEKTKKDTEEKGE